MEPHPLINYTKEAFTLPINLIFLSVVMVAVVGLSVAFSGFTTPVLLLAAIGAAVEMAYLAYAPSNPRFIRAVNARYQSELTTIERQYQSFRYLQQLGRDYLDRYMLFFKKKQIVNDNLLKNQDKTGSLDYTYLEKLNSLESYYVELLYGLEQYERYSKSGSKEELEREVNKIRTEMANASSDKVKNQYQRRIEVLKKRLDKFASATENMQVARIQIDTLEDTMDFIVEQSLTLKNPDEIGRAIDQIILAAEEHHTTIEELDRVLSEINVPSVSLSAESDQDYFNANPLRQ
jgi:hypothetical protein